MAGDLRWCTTTEPYHGRQSRLVSKNPWLVPCFLGVDYVLFAGVGVLWFLLEFTDYLPEPIPRGFWCDDRQYMKPYTQDQVVPERGLYVICFTIPVISILVGESLRTLSKYDGNQSQKLISSCSIKLFTPIRRALRFIGVFAFGGFATWVLTDFIQILTGRMTPYFFTACQPDACSPVFGQADTRFITEYTCLSGDHELIKQARRSLPSIHACLGAYSSVFATVYLSSQLQFRNVRLPIPLFCLAYLSSAMVWGLVRAASYRHHWTDVFAGFALGTSVALYLGVSILRAFHENTPRIRANLEDTPSKSSLFSIKEEHFMKTAPSSFVLPRVQHLSADSASLSYASQQNDVTGHHLAYPEDIHVLQHQVSGST